MRIPTQPLSQLSVPVLKEGLIWLGPTVGIPAFRWMRDSREGNPNRLQNFVRDISTYSVGMAMYFGVKKAVTPAMWRMAVQRGGEAFARSRAQWIDLGATVVALGGNVLYAGLAAVPLGRQVAAVFGDQSHKPPPAKAKPSPELMPAANLVFSGMPTALPHVSPSPPQALNTPAVSTTASFNRYA